MSPDSDDDMIGDVIMAKRSFEEFATNDKFVDQDYYDTESGVVVKDYHLEWVDALENNQKVAITAFTGSGKTSIPGVLYPLWRIFRDPSTNILIISATLSQATRILNEIKHHIEHADYLNELKPEDRSASWSKSKVEFSTGGEIKCKPVGNGAKAVKGAHVDLAICTPGYTRVETPEGSKKIENIGEGDLVKTHKGRFKPVLDKMVRETTGTGYEIDAGGLHVRLTSEHPVRVGDEWVKAEDVGEEDVLQYPVDGGSGRKFELRENGKKDLDIGLDKKFARLLGWYMAEGSLTKRGIRITNADSTDLGQIQSLMDDKLGGYSVDDHLSWSSNVLFSSVDLRDRFEEWFNSSATEKKVPEFIFDASEVVKASFLEAWIRGDGTDVYNDDGELKETTLYTSSDQAVEGAKKIVESIGGEVKVSKHSNEDSTFGGGDKYHVFMHSRTARKVKALATNGVEDGNLLLPVTNVKKTRVSNWSRDNKVYNLKVKDDNSYIANGIATHNCDEAAEFDDQEKFHRNVRTRVESQGGKICLISTPVHENDLMANVSSGEMPPTCKLCRKEADMTEDGYVCPAHGELENHEVDGGENISKMGYWSNTYSVYQEGVDPDTEGAFSLSDGEDAKWVKPLFPENFDRVKIMKLREENMTMFQKEYLCEPLAVEGDVFDPNDIVELYDAEEEFSQNAKDDCRYYMGADFAISHQGDYSVFTVVEVPQDGKPVIKWMERLRGMGLDGQEERIKDLHEIYDFERIVLDETNFGSTAKKNLKQAGLPIRGQDFKMKARNNLIVGLKSKIESEDFKIARGCERSRRLTDKLYNELLGFGTTETQSGSISYQSTAKHDDTVMSLAMVMSAIKNKKDVVATMAF